MNRREDLLYIGSLLKDKEELKKVVNKSTEMDMAIVLYAKIIDKLDVLEGLLDVNELLYDIRHTDNHFNIKEKRNKFIKEYLHDRI